MHNRLVVFLLVGFLLVVIASTIPASLYGQSVLKFETQEKELVAELNGQPIFRYVFIDEQTPRPYFAHIKTPSGKQVSRNHPPLAGIDKEDHAAMHPGVWISFGDLNGHDFWRLKAKTKHVKFAQPPKVTASGGAFEVVNEYRSTDGSHTIATESCQVAVEPFAQGYTLKFTSALAPTDAELTFGDQEEMGLGIRLASALAVDAKHGGRILDSEGRKNGDQIWGKNAAWCDYAGPLEGKWVGMTILTSPKNFRPSWCHARDYGFVAMNPFGLNAFTKAKRNDITVKPGEQLQLGYAVVVHESENETDYNPKAIYDRFADGEKR